MTVNDVTSYEVVGRIAVVTSDSPPVNALGAKVRQGVAEGVRRAEADGAVDALVILCGGRTFYAGADISEFGRPPVEPDLRQLEAIVEACPKPVVAAIHGTALGGGLELAMVAHFRVAVPSAKLGLPEVNLGLLPGAGGTQRLPRIVGVEKALEMMCSGAPIDSAAALEAGLVDALAGEGTLRADAIAFAEQVVREGRPLTRVRDRAVPGGDASAELFERFRAVNAKRFRGLDAPDAIIRAVEEGLKLPFEAGLARERALFVELLEGGQSAALRHVFFAERQAARIDDIPADTPVLPVTKAGVIGAGTMGGGIAMCFLNAGIPVTLVERAREPLERGIGIIRRNYEASAAKGRISAADVERRMALLTPATSMEALSDADLVIEAVFENMEVKRDLFARLDRIAKRQAILATNTSYLDIDRIAAATARPGSVIGLHFFSPANVMKLLEIVRTDATAPAVLATAAKLAKMIGKLGVTVRNGYGFVGNRILAARSRQAERIILEGATPQQVDKVLYAFGFPMGHFQMRDLVGLDVGWNRETSSSSTVREILNEMGRHGQKSGGGFYDYDERRNAVPSPVALEVIERFSAEHGIPRRAVGDDEILDRILYAMVNEAGRILDEGIAARASDIDVIWITGYGFPRQRGGPMFWAAQQGWPTVLARLQTLHAQFGPDFEPAPHIEALTADAAAKAAA